MKLNELVEQSHGMAKDRGWWDKPREDGTLLMLMVCELAEAAEEARNNKPAVYFNSDDHGSVTLEEAQNDRIRFNPKPEGVAIELVDTVIRIADYFGSKGWNLEELVKLKMEYNKDRPYRHGGKKF